MCKVYGYCRISRRTQNIERQLRNVKEAYPDAIIVQEAFTGTKIEGREKFERLLKTVKSGDTIVFDSVSRMSRNAEEGFKVYEDLYRRGVELVFLKEPHINTSVYRDAAEKQINIQIKSGSNPIDKFGNGMIQLINELLLDLAKEQIRLALEQAQKEVDDLHQRTVEGIETARLAGKQIGQQAGRKLNVKKQAVAKEIIRKHSKDFDGTLSDADVIKLAGISRNSFYKYKAELRNE